MKRTKINMPFEDKILVKVPLLLLVTNFMLSSSTRKIVRVAPRTEKSCCFPAASLTIPSREGFFCRVKEKLVEDLIGCQQRRRHLSYVGLRGKGGVT